jgi:hypothetical protein
LFEEVNANEMNTLTYKSKTRMKVEILIERLWERVRKGTQLPIREAIRYWLLKCEFPW